MFERLGSRIELRVALVVALALTLLIASFPSSPGPSAIPPLNGPARFIIADTPVLDEYGQGIDGIEVYENSSGSWVVWDNPFYVAYLGHVFEWTAGVSIKLSCFFWLNSTLTQVTTTAQGKLVQRHNVTVTNRGQATVFSQANLTYVGVSTALDPMWYYEYEVILNFSPDHGEYYITTVTYEVYWR